MSDDIAFHDAHNTFDNHIQQLIGIRWIEIHHCTNPAHRPDCSCAGTSHTSQPSLYTQISTDIGDTSSPKGKGEGGSRPPLWIDGIDWRNRIDNLAQAWTPHHTGGTVTRLDELSQHAFGPDDTPWLTKANKKLASEITKGETLLDGENQRRLDVVAPCPNCGTQTVRRPDSGGDWVRQTALQLTTAGCRCIACNTWWDKDHLNFLAEVIGCERKELA